MRLVIAVGGNAMTGPRESVHPEHQIAAADAVARQVAGLVAAGHQVLLSHGNGPQVGDILAKNDMASYVLTPVPLDWCVADTQGSIGFILLDALDSAGAAAGVELRPAVVVTRALVAADDPAFDHPTKPVGRFSDRETAHRLTGFGQSWAEVSPDRWRRVVPSPQPVEIVDARAIDALLGAGFLVVGGGGGGIPVVRREDGRLAGVEAVIDKDLSSVLLARQLGADALVFATNVDHAWIHWNTDRAQPIGRVPVSQMLEYQRAGHFPAGSMGPKVQAAISFVRRGGPMGVITSLGSISQALDGGTGTVVLPD
jgi:carbamate kinase